MARNYRLGTVRRAGNTIVTALVRRGWAGRSTYLLTTRGRRTGLERSTPVTLLEDDGERWLVAPYGDVGWVHNVRAHPEVTLRRGRAHERLLAQQVDAATAAPVLQRYVGRVKVTAPFFDAKASDPVPAFLTEADRHPVFRLTPPTPR